MHAGSAHETTCYTELSRRCNAELRSEIRLRALASFCSQLLGQVRHSPVPLYRSVYPLCVVCMRISLCSGGHVDFTFIESINVTANTQQVSFYADEYDEWNAMYHNRDLTCQQRIAVAKATYPLSALVATGFAYGYDVTGIIPRWWYIAVSNCQGGPGGTEAGIGVSYYMIHCQ
jgi:hypothetical protein